MIRISNIVNEFNRLLGTGFVPGHPSMKSQLGISLIDIFNLHNVGNYTERDFQLARLEFFLKHLKEIESKDPNLFKRFKKEILRARSSSNFFGIRFEVNIASSLIRKSIPFKRQESPDFIIIGNNIGIECGSTRSIKSKQDYLYKIGACIREKESKGYHTSNTALFIDITNMLFSQGIFCGTLPNKEEIRQATLEFASPNSFGTINLFHYLIDVEKKALISGYIRVDPANIGFELKDFMDEHYPYGNEYVSRFLIPPEGL